MGIQKLLLLLLFLGLSPLSAQVESLPQTHQFLLDDRRFIARIERDAVLASPSWNPTKPFPLSFSKAEQVARSILRKHVSDEPSWRIDGFELFRLGSACTEPRDSGVVSIRVSLARGQ